MTYDFSGKNAIVTGGAGNLGSAVVRKLVAAGARVALVDRHVENGQKLVEELGGKDHCKAFGGDLTTPEGVSKVIQDILADFGQVDMLVHTVGGFAMGDPVHKADVSVLDKMLMLNVRPIFLMGGAVARHLVESERPGKIVFILAQAGYKGSKNKAAYTASKSAAIRLMEAMSAELKEHGINVNGVSPSTIDTPPNRADMPNADFSRWVTPEQLADGIMFLLSPGADAMHGADVPISSLS